MNQRSGIGKVLSFTANVTTAPPHNQADRRWNTDDLAEPENLLQAGDGTLFRQ